MIRVGIVGAGGWAGASHLPALAALDGYEVTAVATTNQASADKVAAAHGVPLAFADAGTLAAHPDVDLVVVSVKASGHAQVIRAALEAGKHVLSEWPLGVDAAEAQDLARAAGAAGVVHAVNLQGYQSPDARYVAAGARRLPDRPLRPRRRTGRQRRGRLPGDRPIDRRRAPSPPGLPHRRSPSQGARRHRTRRRDRRRGEGPLRVLAAGAAGCLHGAEAGTLPR